MSVFSAVIRRRPDVTDDVIGRRPHATDDVIKRRPDITDDVIRRRPDMADEDSRQACSGRHGFTMILNVQVKGDMSDLCNI